LLLAALEEREGLRRAVAVALSLSNSSCAAISRKKKRVYLNVTATAP
jgi:hypothetical protein